MATAITALGTMTLASAVNSVTFSNIPNTYRDLRLVVNSASTTFYPVIRLNGDTGANYSGMTVEGTGAAASSANPNGITYIKAYDNNGFFQPGNYIFEIFDYSQTDKHKTTLGRLNEAGAGVTMAVFRWSNTAAVTSVQIFGNAGNNFATGDTFNLFGIAG